jgi:AcrR family transcriptional regulator
MARAENTAETRAHILDVARREVFTKGYASASINAIVGATSVSKPTVYYHL